MGEKPTSKRDAIPINSSTTIGNESFPIILQTRYGKEKSAVKCKRNSSIEETTGKYKFVSFG